MRARDGDETAWREVVRQHQTRLATLALFITGSVSAADDVVQETFVRALDAKIRHRSGTVQGFLGTIAYRLALKEAKRVGRDVGLDELDLADHGKSALDNILSSERDCLVVEAILTLDSEHRDALILRFYGDCTYEEIAELTHSPLGTVKSRMFYAVKTCRETLRQKGIL